MSASKLSAGILLVLYYHARFMAILLYRTESIELVNTCLRLFRRLRALPKRRTFGYGGCRELVLLLLSLSCRIHEMVYALGQIESILIWWCNTFVVFGSSIMMGITFLGYLSLGLLYSELNDFVRCELRGQLQALERPHGLQPGRQQLRTVRRHLDECLALYREIYCLATSFQQLIEIPFLLTFIHNYILLGVIIYKLTIDGWFDEHKVLLGAVTIKVILDLLLVTLSVDGARTQFRVIRRLSLENCHVSDHADWHMMFDIFVTHLNLYEFRVRPLGLFEISNELVLVFVSALVTFLIYIIQYEMQSKVAWQ
ncbi:putative gustatory receptor 93c [Drosophila obscura]|uniref:putative gustatory receptor 93c n=1 Tax=Drosophila obscura TaxID=7282 RepID=UPI001BB20FB8|nr:putative gustatory receptor 93c [Drosophila obscura]